MTEKQSQAIERHGRAIIALYPGATVTDPVKLCKALRRIETRARRAAVEACNNQRGVDAWPGVKAQTAAALAKLLGDDGPPIYLNADGRGYTCKIDDEWIGDNIDTVRAAGLFARDWGGYGILAPEINKHGQQC